MKMNQLLVRYGFNVTEESSSHAGKLLEATMRNLSAEMIGLEEIDESRWVNALQLASRQVHRFGRECLVNPQVSELPLADIDLYMRGVIRWMNELGIYTAYCCDGHGKRSPIVILLHLPTEKQMNLLEACLPADLQLRRQGRRISFVTQEREKTYELLLEYAECLHQMVQNPDVLTKFEAEKFKEKNLMNLLNIPGASGRERVIRQHIFRKLRLVADDVYIDDSGNVLATIYGGHGPTVLLSAHMDVYEELDPDREIVEDGNWLYSTSGILGADDRAGIAIALCICDRMRRTNFRGTLKLAFTVQEEVGLVGARNIDSEFMQDFDAAIVIDRRGDRDIVTSCFGNIPFCDQSYGMLFEKAGELAGMHGWRTVAGGSSDARIFVEKFNINTVNLSAGYVNEHTDEEALNYVAAYETVKLIETVFNHQLIEEWVGSKESKEAFMV